MEQIIGIIIVMGLVALTQQWRERGRTPQNMSDLGRAWSAVNSCLFWVVFLGAIIVGLMSMKW